MPSFNKLHIRIMLPFLALFLVVNLISLLLDRHYISTLIDERISRQTDRISRVLSNSEFVLNPVYLNKLKDVLEGDIIVFEKTGKVMVSTLSEKDLSNMEREIVTHSLFSMLQEGERKVIRSILKKDDNSSLMISRRLFLPTPPQREMLLCVISPLADIMDAKSRITTRMFLIALCGLLLVALVGYVISISVTRPIKDLVDVTGDIAEGNFEKKTPLPSVEELERLARSINTMTDKLREYEAQVIRSSQLAAAGKVTAAMAHEIRNPLSSIKMMSQLLKGRLASRPEDYKIVEPLLEEVIRLERIVRELTDLAKPSGLSVSIQDINDILEEVLSIIEPKLSHRKIKLTGELQRSMSRVKCDKDRMKQVIWNLVLNAMESMPGGGNIRVISREKQLSNRLEVVIEDEGHGIDRETLEKVFTPFFTTKPEGLGLGLSTSKEIVESHGGILTVENMDIKGVRAVFSLPLFQEEFT